MLRYRLSQLTIRSSCNGARRWNVKSGNDSHTSVSSPIRSGPCCSQKLPRCRLRSYVSVFHAILLLGRLNLPSNGACALPEMRFTLIEQLIHRTVRPSRVVQCLVDNHNEDQDSSATASPTGYSYIHALLVSYQLSRDFELDQSPVACRPQELSNLTMV